MEKWNAGILILDVVENQNAGVPLLHLTLLEERFTRQPRRISHKQAGSHSQKGKRDALLFPRPNSQGARIVPLRWGFCQVLRACPPIHISTVVHASEIARLDARSEEH